jgi:hypothetical protein
MNRCTRLSGVILAVLLLGALAPLPADAAVAEVRMVSVRKEVVGSRPNADGSFTIVYDVTVINRGRGQATYDLVDEPRFGTDVTVDAGSAIDLSGETFNVWDGTTETTVVTGRRIEPRARHTYRVAVAATPGPTATGRASDCVMDAGETGTGFQNTATATDTVTGVTATNQACTPIPELTVVKIVQPGSPEPNPDGSWTVGYRIDVVNPGATPVSYDLDDAMNYGSGVSTDMTWVKNTVPGDVITNPDWDGSMFTSVVTGVDIAPGETHSYLTTGLATVDPAAPSTAADCTLGPGESGTGFLSTATLFASGWSKRAEACVEAPNVVIARAAHERV